jgi:hypothetical protein
VDFAESIVESNGESLTELAEFLRTKVTAGRMLQVTHANRRHHLGTPAR